MLGLIFSSLATFKRRYKACRALSQLKFITITSGRSGNTGLIPLCAFGGSARRVNLVLTLPNLPDAIAPMINIRSVAVVAVALSLAAASACFAASPHMGTWKLNEAKSKLVPGMGKSMTVVYSEKKDKIKVEVDGVDKDGKKVHSVWVGMFDGKAYPTKGNGGWDSAAYKVVNDRENEITTMKGGKVVWTGKITVSADGKSRTVTTNGTDANGKKFKGKAFYDKA